VGNAGLPGVAITPGELGDLLAGWVARATLPDDPLAMRRVIAMAMLFGMERGLELGERGLTVEITAAVRVALREVRG
jgi:hypothetical protein